MPMFSTCKWCQRCTCTPSFFFLPVFFFFFCKLHKNLLPTFIIKNDSDSFHRCIQPKWPWLSRAQDNCHPPCYYSDSAFDQSLKCTCASKHRQVSSSSFRESFHERWRQRQRWRLQQSLFSSSHLFQVCVLITCFPAREYTCWRLFSIITHKCSGILTGWSRLDVFSPCLCSQKIWCLEYFLLSEQFPLLDIDIFSTNEDLKNCRIYTWCSNDLQKYSV